MKITQVRVKLVTGNRQLLAYADIVLDGCFIVRDLKLLSSRMGTFVQMPNKRLTARCPQCLFKNHLMANYCNECGSELPLNAIKMNPKGHLILYSDVAYPLFQETRSELVEAVERAYECELLRVKRPEYRPIQQSPDESI